MSTTLVLSFRLTGSGCFETRAPRGYGFLAYLIGFPINNEFRSKKSEHTFFGSNFVRRLSTKIANENGIMVLIVFIYAKVASQF